MPVQYKIKTEDVSYKLVENEVIVLNLKTGEYYTLDETGSFVWLLLEQKTSIDEIAGKLSKKYGIDKKVAFSDTKLLLKNFMKENLIFII
ncbi:MAG: PqqD family protein [Candidatus Omnitrophica bacterium]|nr:PqqD family protein [Candidatus Omnitrophota bacterium]